MISVILPVRNEAKIIKTNLEKITNHLNSLNYDYEIIIGEDSSTDKTLEVAKKLTSPNVKLFSSPKRLGRGLTIKKAIAASKGDIIVYMDIDLAADLNMLSELILSIENGADISTGSRLLPTSKVCGRSLIRTIFSKGYNLFLRTLFPTKIYDHQCGFKAFRKYSLLKSNLLSEVNDNHWFWDSELLIRGQIKGLKVTEIPIKWTDRKETGVKLHSDIVNMGLAAIRLRLKKLED